jgi:hypothetical protein
MCRIDQMARRPQGDPFELVRQVLVAAMPIRAPSGDGFFQFADVEMKDQAEISATYREVLFTTYYDFFAYPPSPCRDAVAMTISSAFGQTQDTYALSTVLLADYDGQAFCRVSIYSVSLNLAATVRRKET